VVLSELHGSLDADVGARPPRGWAIDVVARSIERLVPGGRRLVVPPTSRASAATLDRQTVPAIASVYREPFPLWLEGAPNAQFGANHVSVALFLGDACPRGSSCGRRPDGRESYRTESAHDARGSVELCDRVTRLRISLRTSRPLTDQEIDAVAVQVLSTGQTLAAVQRGVHP
jgi:hypothetical protein